MFKKLNFTQFSKDAIQIRKRAGLRVPPLKEHRSASTHFPSKTAVEAKLEGENKSPLETLNKILAPHSIVVSSSPKAAEEVAGGHKRNRPVS